MEPKKKRGRPRTVGLNIPHPSKSREYQQEMRKRNRERYRKYQEDWRKNNKQRFNEIVRNHLDNIQDWPTPRQGKNWTAEETAILESHSGDVKEIAKRLGRSYRSVVHHRAKIRRNDGQG